MLRIESSHRHDDLVVRGALGTLDVGEDHLLDKLVVGDLFRASVPRLLGREAARTDRFQPRTRSALAGVPWSSSTSAGRKYIGSTRTSVLPVWAHTPVSSVVASSPCQLLVCQQCQADGEGRTYLIVIPTIANDFSTNDLTE